MKRGAERGKGNPGRLDQALTYRISMVELLLMRATSALYAKEPRLTTHQWKCLAAVGVWGPMQAVQVARHATLDKAAVSRAVRQLVRSGYLERRLHHRDSRMVTLALTKLGQQTFRSITGKIHKLQMELMKGIAKADRDKFFDTLLLIEDRLRAMQRLPSRRDIELETKRALL